jgi:hypothetical protein
LGTAIDATGDAAFVVFVVIAAEARAAATADVSDADRRPLSLAFGATASVLSCELPNLLPGFF